MSSDSAASIPKGTAAALQLVKCKLSASLTPNNLVASTKYFAYIHRNEVQLVDQKLIALGNEKADTIRVAYAEKDMINQIEFIKVSGLGELMVVINQGAGVFIYDEAGQKLLYSYKHTRSSGNLTLKESHLRGVAFDGKETLYVGQGSGDLLVFQLNKSKFQLVKSIADVHVESHSRGGGISALTYSARDSTLISGDDYGNLVFWAGAGADISAQKIVKIEGAGSPVNCLTIGQGHLAAAFASGHLRLYDVSKRSLTVEIGAHSRAINALEIHQTRPLVMCASEDTFVSVWQLPTNAQPQVRHLMAESPVLGLLTGARFAGVNQELIITTVYDSRALAIMHTP